MATVIDTTALFFGAPASLTVGGVEVGATETAPKASVKATQIKPEFQGAGGALAGAVFNTKVDVSVEFDVNELSAAKIAWSMPGATSVVGTGTITVTLGLATTLSADSVAGASALVLTASTNIATGKFLKVGDAGETEIVKVVGYVSGLTVATEKPLRFNHDSGDAVVMVDDAGTTITTWRIGRVASAAFQDVILDGLGVDGRHLKVTVTKALSEGTLDVEMSDSAIAGSHVVMHGHYDGADPTLVPIKIEVG
jgi:hypothetical protein